MTTKVLIEIKKCLKSYIYEIKYFIKYNDIFENFNDNIYYYHLFIINKIIILI